jgi:pyruvate dehydrogenase E1 component alpha subunit
MPKKIIYKAQTELLEILDMQGKADAKLLKNIPADLFVPLYELMFRMRKFDEKALNLQRQGRIGTYGSLRGQEAAQAGITLALEKNDWVVPSFREHGVAIGLGLPMHRIYLYWKGDERGNIVPEDMRLLPASVPVGSQFQHATGLGLAMKLKKESSVAVGFGGDGATSEGDFHEALNFAGVFKAQTLFFIQNNQWAISVPRSLQSASVSLAQKAHAYGLPGLQVDGNDVLAVYLASKTALDHIRSGKGPYLIEAVTYRMGDHTTSDDHWRYRSKEEVQYWEARDPINRMRIFLTEQKLWSDKKEENLLAETTRLVESEVEKLEAIPAPDPMDIFNHMFASMPWNLKEQQAQLKRRLG